MKKIVQLILFASFIALFSCNKETISNTDSKVGISRVTNFPVLALKGDRYIVLKAGTAYTEPGVDATENGATIPFTTDGAVDTSEPGVYTLYYTAVNKDGFPATISRVVVVYATDASAAANDLSGEYERILSTGPSGVISTWEKIAPGVYKVRNPGGASSTGSTVVITFNPTGFEIHIPEQDLPDRTTFTSSNEVYVNATPANYAWKIVNPGYGPALRTFVKL